MSFLRDFVELITVQPGDLVYHLVTLFAIQLVLGVAVGHWHRHRRDSDAIRLMVVAVGLVLARVLLMFVAVLDRIGVLSLNIVLPPLERFLDLATVSLVVWAFLPILGRNSRLGVVLLVLTLLVAVGVYAAFAALWPQAEAQGIVYNGYWQETVWEFLTLAILGLAIVANLIWREGDWGWLVYLLVLWLVGHVLQFTVSFADSHTAGWVRLANLAALPLIAGLAYRRVLAAPSAVSGDAAVDALDMIGVLEAAQRIGTGQDVESALGLAASPVARALGADMTALGLPVPGLAKKVRVVSLHPSSGTAPANEGLLLLASRYPLVSAAIETGRLQRSGTSDRDPAIASLYRRLGFERPGPLLVQPLVDEGALLGIMLAGNPVSQRRWTADDEQIFQAVGAMVAEALAIASRRETVDRSAELQKAIGEARRLARRATELEAKVERERQRAEELGTKLRLRSQAATTPAQAVAESAVWEAEIQRLAQDRAALEAELAEWRHRAEQLVLLKEQLQSQLAQVHAELQETKSQAMPALAVQSIDGGLAGILIGDGQGNIILASRGARNLIGQLRSGLVGTSLQGLFTESLWSQAVGRLLRQEAKAGETAAVSLDLEAQMVRAELTRLPDVSGWPGTVAVMFSPEEEVKPQDEVVLSLVHELRTPMTSITGYTDLLLGESVGILGEMQRQFLQRVKANIERMGGLLEDLVKVTTIDAGQISLSPGPVDLVSVVDGAIASLSAQFSERGLGVRKEASSELPPVHVDRDSLYQIVLHLLSNAGQCSEPGTEVLVGAQLEEYGDQIDGMPDYLSVSVTDTGGGIAPEDRSRVFQRLYRADNPLITGLGDTGVGLSIAKALVEANGGRIWVESEMEVGSTFSFVLPLSPEGGVNGSPGSPSPDSLSNGGGESEQEQ